MRKRVFPRIVGYLLLNCMIFILLAAVQFSRGMYFSQKIGDMLIKGQYSTELDEFSSSRALDGGASVIFRGLEFQLASSSGTGLFLVDAKGQWQQTFPEYLTFTENGVTFTLSGGAELSFINQNSDDSSELQIIGKFSNDISTIEMTIKTHRSSIIRGGDDETYNILHNGSQYRFSRPLHAIGSRQLILAVPASTVFYRSADDKKEFTPYDYTILQAQNAQVFEDTLSRWVSRNFALWGQMESQTDEDTVIAWCGEAARQGSYRQAVSLVPVSFSSSPLRTWESAVYQFDRRIGVWERAARAIGTYEREKMNRISRLLTEKNHSLFTEDRLIEFLVVRDTAAANQIFDNIISFAKELNPSNITLEMSPGILESCLAIDHWRPNAENPFLPLVEQVYILAANHIKRTGDQVFVFTGDPAAADMEFNLRLGTAIYKWERKSNTSVNGSEWAGVGRTIVLSVLSLTDDNGFVPVSLDSEFVPVTEKISTAGLYRIINNSDNLPHEASTGTSGIWAWTAASEINVSRKGQQLDISITFPVGETHYIMFRNITPFALLQIYGSVWRRAVDFESYYDSPGWYYFEQDQTLVVKIRHRSNVEKLTLYYVAPRIPEPEPEPEPEPAAPPVQQYPPSNPWQYQYQYQ